MRRAVAAMLTAVVVGTGCADSTPPVVAPPPVAVTPQPSTPAAGVAPVAVRPPADVTPTPGETQQMADSATQIVALVNGRPITQDQLVKPLIEAYGLNVLLQLIQLELARELAAQQHAVVTANDLRAERDLMLKGAFQDADPKDYDTLLDQLLRQQNLSHAQFEIVLETNAYLRKLAEPLSVGKITDENLRHAFNMMYGEKVTIRDITVPNLRTALQVKQRVATGEDFGAVAEQMSQDIRTRGLKGEMPPFSRQSMNIPDAIKNTAFDMKDGEVSDPIEVEGMHHIIKVIAHIPPSIAKFEDQRSSIEKLLHEKLIQETMKGLRGELARAALTPGVMKIENDELRKQFDVRAAQHKAAAKSEAEAAAAQQAMKAAGRGPTTVPAGHGPDLQLTPATQPTTAVTRPATTQAPGTGAGRPPATTPGAATAPTSAPANPGHPATTSTRTNP